MATILSENTENRPFSPYGKSKLLAENEIKKVKNNLDYVILRLFNTYGKRQTNQYAGVISNFAENISKDNPLVIYGDGKQTRDFVSINDVIHAFDCAIKTNSKGTYNRIQELRFANPNTPAPDASCNQTAHPAQSL